MKLKILNTPPKPSKLKENASLCRHSSPQKKRFPSDLVLLRTVRKDHLIHSSSELKKTLAPNSTIKFASLWLVRAL